MKYTKKDLYIAPLCPYLRQQGIYLKEKYETTCPFELDSIELGTIHSIISYSCTSYYIMLNGEYERTFSGSRSEWRELRALAREYLIEKVLEKINN